MREVVAEIASDDYEGRGPGSAGDERTRAYLERTLEKLGFAPAAGDGRWQQPFELVGIETAQPAQWTFAGERWRPRSWPTVRAAQSSFP